MEIYEKVFCHECECFEPMREQRKPFEIIGACHFNPPQQVALKHLAAFPVVLAPYGFCFQGIRKEER